MVRHIIGWNFKEGCSNEENASNAQKAKEQLEGLKDKIEEIQFIEVITNPLKSTTFDVLLVSEFESLEALEAYQVHEEHIKVAQFIRSVFTDRKCVDYEF